MYNATSYVSLHFFNWLSTTINTSVKTTVCYRITKPEDVYAVFSWLGWNILEKSTSSFERHQLLINSNTFMWTIPFLQFEIKRSQMYLNAALWSVYRRNSLVLYHQISKSIGYLQIFLQTWLPCKQGLRSHTQTTRVFIRPTAFQNQVQAQNKIEVLP